ncbi:DEAD/DEAH box helicase [Lysinibacillus sp. OL1_EC]|uniref:DEAD/DEAH box helicase n=1 Tax=unclassified Lysinibacillus TaxID=2636778 RepID=UPI00103FBD93|nr:MULTISPECIES: DEAD/DEAH box helicase [unclassified Lysinibacillus]MCM0625136.1 DEAD/DEAH box helicase [Lysinibacillus sp. OL1_EC]TBV87398.1 DEAD/DEAH box helicase [Lysinibacillus sp. OL1]
MLNLKEILHRADEITIQEILGTQTVKILNLMSNEGIYIGEIKKIILDLHSEEAMLLDCNFRNIIFDLLRLDEAKTLARILGVFSPQDNNQTVYKKLQSLNFRKNSEITNTLFSVFNVQKNVTTLPDQEPIQKLITAQYSLFEHQRIAAAKVKSIFNSGSDRVLLHMPTGSGKTRTSMNIIADYLRANENTTVIWLANTEELCEQAAQEFEKAWSSLGNRDITVSRFWGNYELDINNLEEGLLVSGLQKLINKSKGAVGRKFMAILANKVSLLVFDEAHQSVAPIYNDMVNILLNVGPQKKLIGLSATPGRSFDNIEEDTVLANFYHRKKVKLEVKGYDNPIDYLTDSGYLAKVNFISLNYENKNLENLLTFSNGLNYKKDYPKEILNNLAEDERRNLLLVNEAIRLTKHHNRIILFAPSVECSNVISFILQSKGIHSRSLTSNTDNNTRKNIISDFKNAEEIPKVLCNYGVLTTGFDAPKTSAAIIGRPTTSLILYSQMVGRAIRGINAGGNLEAEIITVIDEDLPGFRSVSEAFVNWEDVWE